ncbi:prepilin-type N-terminal cleavage/methylation domain-containing protein [Proteobacteria bacterium 005FR1]|nr:prepilin-type N-terminal cleavage/methylation domain-containing protein [Proteobacteria bacterium 005FR1]
MQSGFGPIRTAGNSGFTLIELVTVIVLISIVAVIGGGFMFRAADSYHDSVSRSQLIQQGRQAIERITRELRIAVPASIRVSTNNLCIEWLPAIGGASYLVAVADQSNGAAATTSIDTAPLILGSGSARYVSVGALASAELYGVNPASLALYGNLDTSAIPNVLSLASAKQFLRNSSNRRLFLAEHPKQICVANGRLTLHENYTSTGSYPSSAALDGTPPNAGVLLAHGVLLTAELPFALTSGTEARNTIVRMELPFSKNNERVVLRHQVMVRNVP